MSSRRGSPSDADPAVAAKMATAQAPWPEAITIDTSEGEPPGTGTATAPVQRALGAIRRTAPSTSGSLPIPTCCRTELRPREPHRPALLRGQVKAPPAGAVRLLGGSAAPACPLTGNDHYAEGSGQPPRVAWPLG